MTKWFYLLLFSCLAAGLHTQTRLEKIDDLVAYCQDNNLFNGNILIAEKGGIIYHKSIGVADFANELPLNANTSFCLGSISKQFTAFAIMLLADQGKLSYSTKVGQIFPELPAYMHPITLQNLMQHTSGLQRTHYGDQDGLKNEEIYQNFLQTEGDSLLFMPGTDLRYSNSAYMLLAMIVERVSGQKYETFLRENVWQPLGMTHTFVMSEEDYERPNKAVGFDGFGNKDDFNVLTYGSNGVYASAEDLFRWTQSFSTDLLMDLDDKSAAWQPATTEDGEPLYADFGGYQWQYGFGLFICTEKLEGIIGHTGAFGGFLNIMMHDIINDRDLIILTNNGRMLPIAELGVAIQNILRGDAYILPRVSIDLELRNKYYHEVDSGIVHYQQLKREHPSKYKFDSEWELNRLGYALIADQRYADAVKILGLLVAEFPDRPNPYDSLGEAYYLNGQYRESIASYQKAWEIDENFNVEWIRDMIKKCQEKLATEK